MPNFFLFRQEQRPATLKNLSVDERQMLIAQQTLDLEIAKFQWQQFTVIVGAMIVMGFIKLK